MNRTDRLLAITLELQARRATRAEDLAAQFEVSVRTVYRDIEALCEAGVPVVATPGYGYTLAEGYFLPPVMLTAEEAGMLFLGAAFVAEQLDAPYRQAVDTGRKKIDKLLPETTRQEVAFLQDSLRFVSRIRPRDPVLDERLATIRQAVMDHVVVHLVYQARFGEPTERDVEPHGLVQVGGVWMLVAYCHSRQDMRAFRLDRMERVTRTGRTFTRRREFTLRGGREMEYGDEEVHALFTHADARWAREERHYSFVREEAHPAGVVMVFRPRSPRELLPWLLSWGPSVKVLAPDSVREQMRALIDMMASQYRAEA